MAVGAASILAKVIRDTAMAEFGRDHPHYKWSQNCGYGTKDHEAAIREHGLCDFHRKKKFTEKFRSK